MASTATAPETDSDEEEAPVEFRLDLPSFEGPMDLLLELVRDHEIDIFDIPIALVTEEYLACIERMEELNLDVGGEWLEMASRLMYIKSRTLLPDDEDGDGEGDGPDPREELVRRLIEYERYKTFAEKLEERPALDGEVFASSSGIERFRREAGPPEIREAEVSDLVGAVRRLVDAAEADEEFVYEMTRERLTLRKVILDIAGRLEQKPRITFESLFADGPIDRNRIVTSFVALLEMTRLDMVALFQAKLGEIDELVIERAVINIVEVSQNLELPEQFQSDSEASADDGEIGSRTPESGV